MYQLEEGYPTLLFFKSGIDSKMTFRGPKDKESIMNFLDEQMIERPKVRLKGCMDLLICINIVQFEVKFA